MIRFPIKAQEILRILEAHGFEAYAVGGCVRDSLLGLSPHDWDFCTNALPEQTAACFSGFRVIKTGMRHGTVTVLFGGIPYEITTYRQDSAYSDHRRPDRVTFVPSLKEDLARRDFTVNAMACHPKKGLVDCFGGQIDLRQRLIRCVGVPEQRFEEDALRILRALRFAAVYGFSLEEETARAACKMRELLRTVSGERIREELYRLLCGESAHVMLYNFTSVFSMFLPEIGELASFSKGGEDVSDLWERTVRAVAFAPAERFVRLALLLRDIGKPSCFTVDAAGHARFDGHAQRGAVLAEQALRRLKADRETIFAVTDLVRLHELIILPETRCVLRQMSRIGAVQYRHLLALKRATAAADGNVQELRALDAAGRLLRQALDRRACYRIPDLAVDGRILLNAGAPGGAQLGALLRTLLLQVIDGNLENSRAALLGYCYQKGWTDHESLPAERHADCDGNQRNHSPEHQSDG